MNGLSSSAFNLRPSNHLGPRFIRFQRFPIKSILSKKKNHLPRRGKVHSSPSLSAPLGLKHTRASIKTCPNHTNSKEILELHKSPKLHIPLVFGHWKHIDRMITDEPTCRKCWRWKETPSHVLWKCEGLKETNIKQWTP